MASSSGQEMPEQHRHGNPTSSGRYSASFSRRGPQPASGYLAKKLLVPLVLLITAVFSTLMTLTVCLSMHRGAFCQREPGSSIVLTGRPDGQWTQWSQCNVICGRGNRARFRLANSQKEPFLAEVQPCTTPLSCDDIYKWDSWSVWSLCSGTCGPGGLTKRHRKCRTIKGPTESRNCPGQDQESAECNANVTCAATYHWNQWSSWNSCSRTCGPDGVRGRSRTCQSSNNSPATSKDCPGSENESEPCNTGVQCPVTYRWGQWFGWSPCSRTCGPDGTTYRNRVCQSSDKSPVTANSCVGHGHEGYHCSIGVQCPATYHWNQWSSWNSCSRTCGPDGVRGRSRTCQSSNNSPATSKDCPGSENESEPCNTGVQCPVTYRWGQWFDWSPCSRTCGPDGTTYRNRVCQSSDKSPVTANSCVGLSYEGHVCNTGVQCPSIEFEWTNWTQWGSCLRTCRPGATIHRQRKCRRISTQVPVSSGLCKGYETDTEGCNEQVDCS